MLPNRVTSSSSADQLPGMLTHKLATFGWMYSRSVDALAVHEFIYISAVPPNRNMMIYMCMHRAHLTA